MDTLLNRRRFILGLVVSSLVGMPLRAEDVIELGWSDLLPEDAGSLPLVLEGYIQHDATELRDLQPPTTGVRTDWNGKIVRLPGFIVPIDYSGMGITSFILVPYVGACIHVPPPPANQLVLVTTGIPYEDGDLFDPVWVTGMFSTSPTSTVLAEIGYVLSAEWIEPYPL